MNSAPMPHGLQATITSVAERSAKTGEQHGYKLGLMEALKAMTLRVNDEHGLLKAINDVREKFAAANEERGSAKARTP